LSRIPGICFDAARDWNGRSRLDPTAPKLDFSLDEENRLGLECISPTPRIGLIFAGQPLDGWRKRRP